VTQLAGWALFCVPGEGTPRAHLAEPTSSASKTLRHSGENVHSGTNLKKAPDGAIVTNGPFYGTGY
jgi:hypothetical protein